VISIGRFSKQGVLESNGSVVFSHVHIAKTFGERLAGLQGAKQLPKGYALIFRRCTSVHCLNMLIPICVAYLDENDVCLGSEIVEPWHLGHAPAGTDTIVETAADSQSLWVTGQCYTYKRAFAER